MQKHNSTFRLGNEVDWVNFLRPGIYYATSGKRGISPDYDKITWNVSNIKEQIYLGQENSTDIPFKNWRSLIFSSFWSFV